MSWKRAMVVMLALAVCTSLCISCSRKKKKIPVAPPVPGGSIITVPGDYATIQEGIDAASDGDAVIVSDGTYTGDQGDGLIRNKNLELRGKVIVVQSENGPDNCIIDCEGWDRGFNIHEGENTNTVIRGFTIKNGNVAVDYSDGGGINCTDASPTIDNCVITGNTASGTGSAGGGINCYGSDAVIKNCTITSNSALGSGSHGGGVSIRNGAATVIDCIISNNHADTCGGGVKADPSSETGPATITNCTIDNNSAWWGGGIDTEGGYAIVENCVISNNNANKWDPGIQKYTGWGGGINTGGGGATTFTNCVISGNKATTPGGGVYCRYGNCEFRNCLIISNSREGIACLYGGKEVIITNCVIADNRPVNPVEWGRGIRFSEGGKGIITNSIIWGNTGNHNYELSNELGGGDVTVSYCTIDNGDGKIYDPDNHIIWGDGNIHSDPLFVGGNPFDYHLHTGSPCINAGDNPVVDWDKDLDGNVRIANGAVDMGTYEK